MNVFLILVSIADESGSDSEEENSSADYSSLSEFVSEMRNSEICGEIRGEKLTRTRERRSPLRFLVAKIYPENQEKTACVEYSTVYHPPDELQIPDGPNKTPSPSASGNESSQSMSESTVSSSSNSLTNSQLNSPDEDFRGIVPDLTGTIHDIDSKSSSATITPVTKSFPRPLFDMKTLNSEENFTHASVSPELRAKNAAHQASNASIQRPQAAVSHTDSHDSIASSTAMKTGRSSKNEPDSNPHANASLLQQVGDEIHSTTAGRVVSNMAKMATNKMSELLGKNPRLSIILILLLLSP